MFSVILSYQSHYRMFYMYMHGQKYAKYRQPYILFSLSQNMPETLKFVVHVFYVLYCIIKLWSGQTVL